ncbi:MAG TPA: M14 family metallopeptidase [Anaerolineales bacterium]|nr:M14 family metallopeptidase [Anaerolineales bacterium]
MITDLIPNTYEQSRQRFLNHFSEIQKRWPHLKKDKFMISEEEDLSIDWFISDAVQTNQKVLIFSIAEHGIEGYVGSAMLELLIRDYLPQIDPQTTGLLLIHTINPWGMKHHRRVNPDNIDLNRTFLIDEDFDPAFNPAYDDLLDLICAKTEIGHHTANLLRFFPKLVLKAAAKGWKQVNHSLMLGQYRHPSGLFYGGTKTPSETATVKKLLTDAFEAYPRILHMDMHTGYGPRYQMSIVNSVHEKRPSEQCEREYNYPIVVAANPEEFYAIKGDLIDFVYELRDRKYPDRELYGLAFEFGTYGDNWVEKLRMPFAMHYENALWHQTQTPQKFADIVEYHFEELFNPREEKWKQKAMLDGNQAMQGILRFEGYIE